MSPSAVAVFRGEADLGAMLQALESGSLVVAVGSLVDMRLRLTWAQDLNANGERRYLASLLQHDAGVLLFVYETSTLSYYEAGLLAVAALNR